MLFGVAAVHAEQIGGEQGRFVAAGAGAHFEDGALLVGCILGQQVHAQLLLHLRQAGIDLVELLLGQILEVLVGGGVVHELHEIAPLAFELAQLLHASPRSG